MQQIFTIASACLFIFIINFFDLHATSVNGEILPSQQCLGDVAINRGSLTNATALDGRHFLVAFGRLNMNMNGLTIFLALTCAAVYLLRHLCEHKFWLDKDKHVPLAPNEPSCYRFSLTEIISATRNFDDALVIGNGGFGKVYKGSVSTHSKVLAIKRLNAESRQGAQEFWSEIETLSKLRHIHLVPLLGYCNEGEEKILVYEYMPRGTVADNIYKARMNGDNGIPLTWEQRLRICIGAARGLEYLHTGTQYGIIHRDVKDTNILLDENYVAKISDFGLSKQGSIAETQDQLSTRVVGTFGYLDPHYFATHKPSIATDVYAFGVVLLVVLSGRPALENKFPGEIESLLVCFRECVEKGEVNKIIDPSIQEEISAKSLKKFIEAVENCLHHLPKKRATMTQLVAILEKAKVLQSFQKSDKKNKGEKKGGDAKNGEEKKSAAAAAVEGGGGGKDDGQTTIVLKTDFHCEYCATIIEYSIRNYDGVEDVKTNYDTKKVTVIGNVDPNWLREEVEERWERKVELVSP